jgi:hypothetical protein
MGDLMSGRSKVSSITWQRLPRICCGLAILATVLVLPGCATYSAGFAKVESAAANRDLNGAIKSLDDLKLTGPDELLHHLNKGTLLSLQGNYVESNKHFDVAKSLMEKLNAISITEQAASVTVNDTLKAYEGLPSEQLMVYSFEALNYLQMDNLEDAAVEARQFDVKQGLIAEKNKGAKYLSGAFVRYLNGMVYEAVGERDEARIEMQKALEGYKAQNSGFPVPQKLREDLARLNSGKPAASEVVFILHNGLGASVDENNIRVVNPNYAPGQNKDLMMLSLAVPKFVKRSLPVDHVVLSSSASSATSEVVEDVNGIAEKSFNDRLPTIIARGVARMVVKNVAAKAAKDKVGDNALFNFVADVATNASERADTRSWSLLPGNIQMARLALPPGKHDVTATYYSAYGNIVGTREFKGVEVRSGRKIFVSDYYLNPPAPPKAAN